MRNLLVASTILLAAGTAAAQPSLTAPARERHGLFGGGGLYGGNISCDGDNCGDFRSAGGANFQIGYLFGPSFGLILDGWAMASSENDVAITYVTGTLNARLWLAPRIWIEGGLGTGHAEVRVSAFGARGDDVPVGTLSAGVELARGDSWVLDVSARVAQGTKTNDSNDVTTGRMAGVGVTMTWYSHQSPSNGQLASR